MPEPTRHPRLKFGIIAIAIIAVWMIVLPRVARQPSVHEHLMFLDEKGIDASAMYYTELEAMDAILQRLESP